MCGFYPIGRRIAQRFEWASPLLRAYLLWLCHENDRNTTGARGTGSLRPVMRPCSARWKKIIRTSPETFALGARVSPTEGELLDITRYLRAYEKARAALKRRR
jgi:hypothetical protein